jgi:hypothetical protein
MHFEVREFNGGDMFMKHVDLRTLTQPEKELISRSGIPGAKQLFGGSERQVQQAISAVTNLFLGSSPQGRF